MLINRAPVEESERVGKADIQILEDNSKCFEAADEIYQIMAETNVFERDGDKALTTSDLVILYKNIDIGTKLVSNTDQDMSKSPNQYVETVIYNDDQESVGSDVSEDISNENLSHVFEINNERLDLFNNFGDKLCPKFGDIEMRTSGLTTDYDRHFLFNDTYIKEQFKSFHTISNSKQSDSTVLPASLLDYICCKRQEDNYNFYMDNIIKYVQNTIEQLKRISNGDYLTDKAKEKWSECDAEISQITECKKIILASSASTFPMHVADKRNLIKSTWDNIVHSEMDVRSITKILEKKIIIEIPKIICGTYELFRKRCNDNLIIKCKKKVDGSRLDVVFKLQRCKSGKKIISNIDSIMILKSLPTNVTETETCSNNPMALEFENVNAIDNLVENTVNITEFEDNFEGPYDAKDCSATGDRQSEAEKFSDDDFDFSPQRNGHEDNEYETDRPENDFNTVATDDLHCIIQRLSMQSPVIEETEVNLKKKKSPMRVRIKSPYENKTYVMEEQKRKKLLEIRQRREGKKNALSENCKVTKNRHEKSGIMAQASNSVTKLSITNKHFYNSIYGESMNLNYKYPRKYHKDPTKVIVPGIKIENCEETHYKDSTPTPLTTPEKNDMKYINRSFYLDDADTEVMHLETKENKNQELTKDEIATTITNNDIGANLNLLQELMVASTTDLSLTDTSSSLPLHVLSDSCHVETEKENIEKNVLMTTRGTQAAVSTKTPKVEVFTEYNLNTTSSVECRKSIDKIYELIKKISETDNLEAICSNSKIANHNDKLNSSDSGTSIKHQLIYTNSSCLNFEKPNTGLKSPNEARNKFENQTSVISKVKIGSKSQSNKFNYNTNNHNKKLTFCKIPENPLKAISQLIHAFDSVQKKINKNGNDLKNNTKKENRFSTEDRSNSRPSFSKRIPKQDQNLKDSEGICLKKSVQKEKRRQSTGYGPIKFSHQELQSEENSSDKINRKKIADIIDEVKELRGEAVRGPPKRTTKLYNLAQPKKLEETQNRVGKRDTTRTDRLSRPTIPVSNPDTRITSLKSKPKKVSEGQPTKPVHTIGPPIERSRTKTLTHNSLNRDGNGKSSPVFVGGSRCNRGNVNRPPELWNKKYAEMKTNIKSDCGYKPQSANIGNSHNALKSRVPFIPTDLDLVSMTSSPSGLEESSVLGKKLHNIIDSIVNSNTPTLAALSECKESISKSDVRPDDCSKGGSKSDEIVLSLSDYPVDIFQDKNIDTAVSRIPKDNNEDEVLTDRNTKETCRLYSNIKLLNIEDALERQISNETFQPLSIKNSMLKVTSEPTEEKAFIFKPRHPMPLVLKSKLSPSKESLNDLKILPALFDIRKDFGLSKFPMQIATVGYVFPNIVKYDSMTSICLKKNENTVSNSKQSRHLTNNLLRKSMLCLKSVDKEPPQETLKKKETTNNLIPNANKNRHLLDYNKMCATVLQNNSQGEAVKNGSIDVNDEVIKNSNMSNSTSLDILVGLLNEIKKMTTYEAHLPKQDTNCDIQHENKRLQIILGKVPVKKSSDHHSINSVMSLSTIDSLQILKARPSNLRYLSNSVISNKAMVDKQVTPNSSLHYKPLSVDKEVNTKILSIDYMHKFTEAPLLFSQSTVSTNVTDSLLKLTNKSSTGSIYSFNDCESLCHAIPKEIMEVTAKPLEKCNDTVLSPAILEIQYPNHKEISADLKKLAISQNNYSNVELDSLIKIKRDILVTVYSVLVLTVFAALSFPEIMYRI